MTIDLIALLIKLTLIKLKIKRICIECVRTIVSSIENIKYRKK